MRRRFSFLHPALTTATVGALAVGCAGSPAQGGDSEDEASAQCAVAPPDRALPADRTTFGVNPDWGVQTLQEFATTTGVEPGAAVQFIGLPFTSEEAQNVLAAADQVNGLGGVLVLTLEPHDGLDAVTDESIQELTDLLAEVNGKQVPVLLRFAHEMNGSWYPWGQQPQAFVDTFRAVAAAVHEQTPATQMMWAPNYGGGYPFTGGQYAPEAGTADFDALDTDKDGELTEADDPYQPYYPGDDAVDWVGMTLYHWGSTYPWGGNNLPETEKFAAQLRGTYDGIGGDESGLPDFYAIYSEDRDKPLAIPETAAFVTEEANSDYALEIRRAWWQQVFSENTRSEFPNIRLINWFNWDKHEPEADGIVRWSITSDQRIADAFRSDLPDWVTTAEDVTTCQ